MTIDVSTAIVVPVELEPSLLGAERCVDVPFGRSNSLLHATVDRLVASSIAPVVVCYRGTPGTTSRVREMLEGISVHLVAAPPTRSGIALAVHAIEAIGAESAIVVDPRAAFVSPTILRRLLAHHHQSGGAITISPLSPPGLSGVVVSRRALGSLTAAGAARGVVGNPSQLQELVDELGDALGVTAIRVDPRFICIPCTLLPRTAREVARLSPLALAVGDEDYEPVFDVVGRWQWRQETPPRGARAHRPKVLAMHYTSSREPGSTRAFEIALEHWNHDQHEIVVAVPPGALSEHLRERMPVRETAVRWLASRASEDGLHWSDEIEEFSALLAAEQPAMVYVSGSIPAMAVAARAAGIPTLCHFHIPVFAPEPAGASVLARAAQLTGYDLVVATSHWYAESLRRAFRPPPGRLIAIPCGIPIEPLARRAGDRAGARRQLGLPEDASLIITAGALSRVKRPEFAIATLAALIDRVPRVHLAMAGGERFSIGALAALEQLATSLGVRDRLHLLGHVDDMPAVYAASDVLLHGCTAEPFGLVLVEAMATSRPVVAAGAWGPAEIVEHGGTGSLYSPDATPAEVAELLIPILNDPARAAALGHAGSVRARRLYDAARYGRELCDACSRLIAGSPAIAQHSQGQQMTP